jgi:hypothetical protein
MASAGVPPRELLTFSVPRQVKRPPASVAVAVSLAVKRGNTGDRGGRRDARRPSSPVATIESRDRNGRRNADPEDSEPSDRTRGGGRRLRRLPNGSRSSSAFHPGCSASVGGSVLHRLGQPRRCRIRPPIASATSFWSHFRLEIKPPPRSGTARQGAGGTNL